MTDLIDNKNTLTKEEKKLLNKLFLRNGCIFISSNSANSSGRAFCYSMIPVIETFYNRKEEQIEELHRHLEYFNTHTVFSAFIAGVVAGMEKERALNRAIDGDDISKIKASLMGPLAGIGDSFFFNCVRVIAGGIAIGLSAGGSILGPLAFLLLYGGIQLICKYYLIRVGYISGTTLIDKAFSTGIIPMFTKAAGIIGTTMIGAMVASNVQVNITATPVIYGATLNIQEIFDTIAPGILSIILFFIIFSYVRTNKKPLRVIFILLVSCIIGAAIGIF